jgi:hypothetical protein
MAIKKNEEAIGKLNEILFMAGYKEALDLAIKALNMVEQLENMRDNIYRLYEAENGNDDYSYGRMQALGAVHSDLEELLEEFDRGGRE